MKKIICRIFMSLCMLLLLIVPGRAEWVPDGSTSLSVNGDESASSPHIESDHYGTLLPHVIWSESAGEVDQIYVSIWETTDWTEPGESLNRVKTHTACAPRLIVDSANTPYAAWLEQNTSLKYKFFVSCYSGTTWIPLGEKINMITDSNAHSPDITLYGSTPIVCWQDEDEGMHKIKVAQYNGSAWDSMGTELNYDGNYNAFRPRIAGDLNPLVTWYEATSGATQVYVKTWNATTWEVVGNGSLNMDGNKSAQNPDIAAESVGLYVAWEEHTGLNTEVFVKYFNMTEWQPVGTGSLNASTGRNAHSAGIALYVGTPFVAWCESDGNTTQVYVKKYNGSNWEQIGGSLNMDVNFGAKDPSITVVNGTPYVTWEEWDATLKSRVYVKHWDDTLLTTTATPTLFVPTDTFTITPTATPTATPTKILTETPTETSTETQTLTGTPIITSNTFTPTETVTITVQQETFTPTMTYVPDEHPTPDVLTHTVTPTELKRKPDKDTPVVIRGNVLKPSTQRPMQIAVYLEKSERVKVKIYSLRGKLIKTLVDEVVQAGNFEAIWNGVNKNGSVVRSGIYIVYIETESFTEKRKMVVIR